MFVKHMGSHEQGIAKRPHQESCSVRRHDPHLPMDQRRENHQVDQETDQNYTKVGEPRLKD